MWLNLKNTKLSKRSQQKRVYTILSRNQINDYLRMELSMVGIGDREGNGTPLHYCCLENPMDGGTWWATVHGIPKSRT